MNHEQKLTRRIRAMIGFFVVMLMLSGITAFPVYSELKWIMDRRLFANDSAVAQWMQQVWLGVGEMNGRFPFLFYGYDWLAFAHIMIGLAFIGPFREPVRNKWVIDWAILACICIIPLAAIAGPIRGIPWFHILIDCSFGVLGIIPLLVVRKWIVQLEQLTNRTA